MDGAPTFLDVHVEDLWGIEVNRDSCAFFPGRRLENCGRGIIESLPIRISIHVQSDAQGTILCDHPYRLVLTRLDIRRGDEISADVDVLRQSIRRMGEIQVKNDDLRTVLASDFVRLPRCIVTGR